MQKDHNSSALNIRCNLTSLWVTHRVRWWFWGSILAVARAAAGLGCSHTHTHRLWLTQWRGGDAGWGQQQGEAEERLTARAQPWNTATNTHWKTTSATERGFISRRRGYDFCDPLRQRAHLSPLILRWNNWHWAHCYSNITPPDPIDPPSTPPLHRRLDTEMHTEIRNTKVSPFIVRYWFIWQRSRLLWTAVAVRFPFCRSPP